MSLPEQLNKLVQSTTGPSPWFWETFPEVRGGGSRRYRWRFHGQRGGIELPGDTASARANRTSPGWR